MSDLKPTQADRDAAFACLSAREDFSERFKGEMLGGKRDRSNTVQAFARYRTDAFKAGMLAGAEIAARSKAYDDNLQKSAGCSTTGNRIAQAIRDAAEKGGAT